MSLPSNDTRWETRQAFRMGQAADIKICSEGARPSAGAIATVHVRCGREHQAETLARLIAAAPELLEALLDLMPVVNRIMYLSNGTWDLDDEEAVQQARALLARLEGGAA